MSGLTVGYLSISKLVLDIQIKTGTPVEKEEALKISPILAQRYWLLVTLLICNATCLQTLPIILNQLVNEVISIIISVVFVLIMGEIVPQAVCTGPNQIYIAAKVAPFVKLLMWLTVPISYPLAKIIECILGKQEDQRFDNEELKMLIQLHTKDTILRKDSVQEIERAGSTWLDPKTARLMSSLVDSKTKTVQDIYIKIENVYTIDYDDKITEQKLKEISESGYSRLPVTANHEKDKIKGIVRIKDLFSVELNENKSLQELKIHISAPITVAPYLPIIDLIREFGKGKSHLFFIAKETNNENSAFDSELDSNSEENDYYPISMLGILTMEDAVEKLLNIDIDDEDDYAKKQEKLSFLVNRTTSIRQIS